MSQEGKAKHEDCMQGDQCCLCAKPSPDVIIEDDDGVLHGYCKACAAKVLGGGESA